MLTPIKGFVALAGSYARGDWNERSDVDLVVIGDVPDASIAALSRGFSAPVSVISFSTADFERLFLSGSLFLHHCLHEGRLLLGDQEHWLELAADFRVQRSFRSEIERCAEVVGVLSDPKIFGGYFRSPLVIAYTQIKNAAIFFLAQEGIYCFNKHECLSRTVEMLGAGDIRALQSLRDVYDYSERGLDIRLPYTLTDDRQGEVLLGKVEEFMRGVVDASCG